VFFYRALASRLGPDRPVYGVRAETRSDGRGRPFDRSHSIEQLAARYIAEIKTAQPKGPYSLGGACVGGVIAFEMARQLRAQGEEVACPLLLFDAFVRNDPQRDHSRILPPSRHKEDLNRRIATHLARVSQLGRVKAVRSLARKILGKIRSTGLALAGQLQWLEWTVSRRLGRPVPLELMQRRIMEGFLERSAKLQSKYMPGVWEGRIVLFKAAEGSDPEPLWTGLAQGGMVVHRMPGFHLDMMEEPFVITTAALVAEYLDRDRIPT
jgi:aspartate racemase